MDTILPKGEKIRQAVRWISEELKADPNLTLSKLIEKAAYKFNLSPKEEEELKAFYCQR